ncbi:MAG: 50S ribosomal protein L11 methyltransferase [Acidobacteria bacterium]|nr:50S ribosomal protein L11 methyltransferase [Acidobacteriota bacterium]
MKVWYSIEVEISRAAESAATTRLWAHQTTGFEVSEDPARPDEVVLRAYFGAPPDADALRQGIIDELAHQGIPATALRRIESLTIADQDWLAEWKKGYEPVEIGQRLLICPSWKREKGAQTNRLVVEIDPGMAFGTGTHETTRGCLEMIEKYWKGGALLDVGTGTGILAMAAARLHPESRIVGFDNDPEAIEVAIENAENNGLAETIDLEVNRLQAYAGGEFDLVVANLTADVIIPLAPDFSPVLPPHGILILSGILREQEEQVRQAFTGLTWLDTKPENEWVTLVGQYAD